MTDLAAIQEASSKRWDTDDGEYTRRITFPINNQSLVYDVGGYNGRWSAWIAKKYNSTIHIFEPIKEYCGRLLERFETNKRVSVFNFGLLDRNQFLPITKAEGESSLYAPGVEQEDAEFRDISELPPPSLISINAEGVEYVILPRMLETGWAAQCQNIQVQFHTFYPGCVELREEIRSGLSKTHHEVYNYPFVWEAWARNE